MGLAIAALLVAATAVGAEAAGAKEYQVKAAFLFNFAQFVEWPADAFPAADAPIRIGVLGEDPFGDALDRTIHGETVRSHPLVIRRAQRSADLADCQLVFISRSEAARVPEVIASLGNGGVLTVSDIDGFADRGGAIGLYLDGKRVRFAINLATVQQQGLKMSAQLLKLGKVVAGTPPRGD